MIKQEQYKISQWKLKIPRETDLVVIYEANDHTDFEIY